ncbi:MAG TPA: FecR domain-containing protein, partial [Chitinophagaceae bacterium]|nr:FecR domain-containing protein [Chitinophagaceae bacterium]
DEEAIKTTLLEGAVKVSTGAATALLAPGQQATISNQSPNIPVRSVDIEQVVAWKNGVFNFQNATLEEVMRQLARWYDIEIVYEKDIPHIEFEGDFNRQNELAEVLRILERMGVHFKLGGRRLTVLP